MWRRILGIEEFNLLGLFEVSKNIKINDFRLTL